MGHTHLLVKVNSVTHESRVVDEVKACPVLWYVALEEQLLPQLYTHAWMKHLGVPQTVDQDDHVVVELPKCLAANVKGLLKNPIKTSNRMRRTQQRKVEKEKLNHSPALWSLTTCYLLC